MRCYVLTAWLSLSTKKTQPDREYSQRRPVDQRICMWGLQHLRFPPRFLSSSAQHHKLRGCDFAHPCRHRQLCAFPLHRAHTQKPVPHRRHGLHSLTQCGVLYLLGWPKGELGEGGGMPQGCSRSTQGISEPTFP